MFRTGIGYDLHRLAAELGRAGREVWVLGSARDAEAGRYIAERTAAVNLCGRTSLTDAIDLLALCGQAVSNDSGLMHMAAAVGCEVHAIYGSSSPTPRSHGLTCTSPSRTA